jgi:predicted AAA+ superfamily ATPase
MKYLDRSIFEKVIQRLKPNKVIVLLGARRIGKTIFLNNLIEKVNEPYLLLNGEDGTAAQLLAKRSIASYKVLLENTKLLVIDEAQKVPQIGQILKLIVDEIKGIKIIVTGSSTYDLNNQLGEPLTGRKITFNLYPLAQMEFSKRENLIQTRENLEDRLIFGSYPELLQCSTSAEKTDYLRELVNAYLLKDILAYEGIRNSSKLLDLLRLLAFQIGKEISYHEIGTQLGMSKNTVERYMDLLSKVFVIYKLQAFSRNLRKEISKSSKWYFYDNGIRNTLIANHNPLHLRNDVGELWENYLITERMKYQSYTGLLVNNYFWRTYQQQEVDWIEERGGKLHAFEIKWNEKKKAKVPSGWKEGYPDASFKVIDPDSYLEWIT